MQLSTNKHRSVFYPLQTAHYPLFFKELSKARALGAACDDTKTPSSQFRDTAPRHSRASAQITLARDELTPHGMTGNY